MEKICKSCAVKFEVTDEDLQFYDKISPSFRGKKFAIPSPTCCPDCRLRRRMVYRNERNLYLRPCDLCSKDFLSFYRADALFPVYCYDCFWSDDWDPLRFGRSFDFNRSFFEQFNELANVTPHLGILHSHDENSDYANCSNYIKNCYFVFGCHGSEDCYYDWRNHDCRRTVDCLQMNGAELCYECIDCDGGYNLRYSQDCENCSDSSFLYDCKSCKNCIFSAGLRNKEFCIFNKQYSKEDYEAYIEKLDFGSRKIIEWAAEQFAYFLKTYPRRASKLIKCEESSGDHLLSCKNIKNSFNTKNAEDGAFLESCVDIKDAYDCTFSGYPGEFFYENISAGIGSYNQLFTDSCWTCTDNFYNASCHNSKNLFGCFSLKKNQYCILNKQYSESEYFELLSKIIEHMQKPLQGESPLSGVEFGEFFPIQNTPFYYNETIANEYFPLTKERAEGDGFRWMERDAKQYQVQTFSVPDSVSGVADDILKNILACESCGKNFKIIAQELKFYRDMDAPIPSLCFGCRHTARFLKRNARELWVRNCNKCGCEMSTTYSPNRLEIVYCEKCYLSEVY